VKIVLATATFFLLFNIQAFAQLVVNTAATPAQMVSNIVGGGITVSNIQYSGAAIASGSFTGGAGTNLGFSTGIILTSGNATGAPGPNNSGSYTGSNGSGSDPQLANLIPGYSINDAVFLKFDLVPLSDTVKFRYVFGSEEYPEWVSSSFNDVFGFFISGPNPGGGTYNNKNIAIIPGTQLPVTIDNVNANSYSQYYVNNSGGATIQYDGFTKVLTAWAKVVPCQTYTLKLAIGDAGDSAYDSAVFIEENSLVASGNSVSISVGYSNPGVNGTNAIEACKNAVLTFSLPSPKPSPTVVNFTVGGTAVNGVDYTSIPTTVTISPNQTSTTLTIVPVFDGIAEGVETVIISFQNSICGGSTSTTINIQDNTTLNVTPSNNTSVCNGNSATISATPSGGLQPYTYQWSNGAGTTQSVNVTPIAATTYKVTVSDACGQTTTAQVVVNVGTVSANAGNNQIVCAGQSVNLTAYGGANYSWSNGSNSQSINVTPASSITYIVTVSDNNGCTATDDVLVTVNPLPLASAGANQSICIGNSTTLNGSGGTTYMWAPVNNLSNASIQNPVANPSSTTTYSVTVTNSNGCSATNSMVLTVNQLPPASAGNNTSICIGYNTTLNASGGTSYVWSPATALSNSNISNPVANPTVTTTYSVTVTDANTCSATSSMVLNVNSLPPASAGNDQAICINASVTLNATGGVSYIWSPATGLTNSNIFNPVASPTITTTYSVTVTDISGCSATDNMVLVVNSLPNASAGNDSHICPNTGVQLNASGGQTYLWSPSSGISDVNISNPQAQPATTTTYTVQVTDINGCIQTDAVTVNIFTPPLVSAGNNAALCIGNSTSLTASGGVSYSWNTGDQVSSITISPIATSTYAVTATDINGCSASDDVVVTVNILPAANAGNDISVCTGDLGTLNASGGVSYVWSPATGLSNANISNPLANPTVQTTYTVTVTDINGCSATDGVIVSIFPSPLISFTADLMNGCPPLLVNFTDGTTPAIQSWVWDFGDPASGIFNNSSMQHPSHLFEQPGTYSVSLTVTTTDGCVKSLTNNNLIHVYSNPTADFTATPHVTTLEAPVIQFLNYSFDAVSCYWNFGEPASNTNTSNQFSPAHLYGSEGIFNISLYVESSNGCVDSTSHTIQILPIYTFYIPNAFTPNGDGINDFFIPEFTNFTEFSMLIYDRWGERVFETNNALIPWDGHVNDSAEMGTQDVYSYVIVVKDIEGEIHKYIGRVALLR